MHEYSPISRQLILQRKQKEMGGVTARPGLIAMT